MADRTTAATPRTNAGMPHTTGAAPRTTGATPLETLDGPTLLAALLEPGEPRKKAAYQAFAKHVADLAAGTAPPDAPGDLLLGLLRARRSLTGGSNEVLLRALRGLGPPLAAALARMIPARERADLHALLDLAHGVPSPDLLPVLKPVAAGEDRWAAALALQAIAAVRHPDAVQALVQALPVDDVRWTAVSLLAEVAPAVALPALVRLLGDPSPEVRLEVLRAIRAAADPRAIPALRKVLAVDPEQRVREAALAILRLLAEMAGAGIGDDEVRAAMAGIARSEKAVDKLLREARIAGASDLHIVPGSPPAFRVHGELVPACDEPLTPEAAAALVREMLPEGRAAGLAEGLQADFPYVLPGAGRHRVNVFSERRGLASVVRLIAGDPPPIEALGLPVKVGDVVSMQQGLVLVTGRTGAGKTTTMAALVGLIAAAKPVHVITLEDPIEYLHDHARGLVNQREIGKHSQSFPAALRSALREDPDVIVVGEMRDVVTMRLAVEAAETGHLVLATLHTPTAIGAVQRLIESFPAVEQQQVRLMLSDSLRMVISQMLLRRVDALGRIACFELLVATHAIASLVRENKLMQVPGLMQIGKGEGQQTFDGALLELLQAGRIGAEDAFMRAVNKEPFRPFLKGGPNVRA
ncbi:MAG: PilT/PilU family type 4a pilus ATPase [Deltaproteobacteria bacterium]|nr:PilT/PilU family type 4a pilus ATPase [Deltaproteobacteria bacterium]